MTLHEVLASERGLFLQTRAILFIGLDTHKKFTEVAFIEDQRGAKRSVQVTLASIHLGF